MKAWTKAILLMLLLAIAASCLAYWRYMKYRFVVVDYTNKHLQKANYLHYESLQKDFFKCAKREDYTKELQELAYLKALGDSLDQFPQEEALMKRMIDFATAATLGICDSTPFEPLVWDSIASFPLPWKTLEMKVSQSWAYGYIYQRLPRCGLRAKLPEIASLMPMKVAQRGMLFLVENPDKILRGPLRNWECHVWLDGKLIAVIPGKNLGYFYWTPSQPGTYQVQFLNPDELYFSKVSTTIEVLP